MPVWNALLFRMTCQLCVATSYTCVMPSERGHVAIEFNEKVDDCNIRIPSMNILPSLATKKTNFEGQYVYSV